MKFVFLSLNFESLVHTSWIRSAHQWVINCIKRLFLSFMLFCSYSVSYTSTNDRSEELYCRLMLFRNVSVLSFISGTFFAVDRDSACAWNPHISFYIPSESLFLFSSSRHGNRYLQPSSGSMLPYRRHSQDWIYATAVWHIPRWCTWRICDPRKNSII